MNCRSVNNIWDYYWDGRLLAALEEQTTRHIVSCPKCQEQTLERRQLLQMLGAPAPIPVQQVPQRPVQQTPRPASWLRALLRPMAEWDEFTPAYAVALIYLCLTPVLKSMGMRFF